LGGLSGELVDELLLLSEGFELSTGFEVSDGEVLDEPDEGDATLPVLLESVLLVSVEDFVFESLGDVVVVVDWVLVVSVVLAGLLESCAWAPNAVRPSASAAIAKYFIVCSPWLVSVLPRTVSTQRGDSNSRHGEGPLGSPAN
jgi:hypothetical protein